MTENNKDNNKNIFVQFFEWCKRSFLHPTTILYIIVITVIIFFLYDKQIKIIDTKQELCLNRISPNASLMCGNKVLITGGHSFIGSFVRLKSTEIYDIKSKKIYKGPDLNISHSENCQQFLLPSCEIVVSDAKGIEVYNPISNKFELIKENINSTNINYLDEDYTNYTLLKNGNILITGGQDVQIISKIKVKRFPINKAQIFDIKSKKIKKIQDLPFPIEKHSAYLDHNGDVYIIGGLTLNDKNKLICNTKIIKYENKTETFSIVGQNDKINLTYFSKIYNLNDNEIIIIGGTSSNYDCDKISKLNLKNYEFSELYKTNYKPFPKNNSIFKYNNKIYFFNYIPFLHRFDIFDINKKKMKYKFSKKIYYGSTILQINKNELIIIGGADNKKIYIIKIKDN